MHGPKDKEDYAETQVLDKDREQEHDPDATVVLGEDYRREVEKDSKD